MSKLTQNKKLWFSVKLENCLLLIPVQAVAKTLCSINMRGKVIVIFLLILNLNCFSQNHFMLNTVIGDSVEVTVNGTKIFLRSEYTKVKTNYPKFDTLFLSQKKPIICNFKPDTNYSVSGACCATLDIIPSSKLDCDSLKIWDFEVDASKIQRQLMDRPFISLRLSQNKNDTIYGWYADYACMPKFKALSKEAWGYGVPVKCFYWSNISPFIFFKSDEDYSRGLKSDGTVEDEYPDFEKIDKLASISLRLFDNQKFILTYDVETETIQLEYE